jgi:hypothetical protein
VSAHDQVLLSYTDDDLERTLYTLHDTTKQFGMETFLLKSKLMAFKGQVPIRSKLPWNKKRLSYICGVKLQMKGKRTQLQK